MGSEPLVRLEIRSRPECAAAVRDLVNALARRLGHTPFDACQIALAVDEAVANVICHGYGRAPDRAIWLTVWGLDEDGALRIVVEDEGRQVDPETIKSRDLDEVRPGGLGVHIIRHVMDRVVYEKRDGTDGLGGVGMRLTMEKRRAPTNASTDASADAPSETRTPAAP